MKPLILAMLIVTGLTVGVGSFAQTAPTVTATCKDGTTFSGTSKRGACSGHGGVQAFTTPPGNPAPTSPTAPTSPAAAPGATATKPSSSAPQTTSAAAASAAHPGQVWVNTASKVYHCPGDRYFGNTKQGEYMTEADAKSKGFRASGGRACSS